MLESTQPTRTMFACERKDLLVVQLDTSLVSLCNCTLGQSHWQCLEIWAFLYIRCRLALEPHVYAQRLSTAILSSLRRPASSDVPGKLRVLWKAREWEGRAAILHPPPLISIGLAVTPNNGQKCRQSNEVEEDGDEKEEEKEDFRREQRLVMSEEWILEDHSDFIPTPNHGLLHLSNALTIFAWWTLGVSTLLSLFDNVDLAAQSLQSSTVRTRFTGHLNARQDFLRN
ncbi:unnamed protein product [Hydatigera taeniaeformis]|uniref:SWIM-type domain-containing protein n=1 Tax=Hydatigena taeniaeformis TaxID=6205 RepID=A0A0R3X8L5_HYDTA|nr:unnamed protein product [Hydatigera taeniaeformis]